MSIWDDIKSAAESPTTEEVIGAVPALIGGYEAARGRPIGAPLSMLGNLALQHGHERSVNAQNLEQGQASVMGQLQNLAARFPNDPSLTNANSPQINAIGDLATNDPQAAANQISQMYNERLADENAQKAQQEDRIKLGRARPQFDKAGRAWRYDPATDRTERSPQDDIPGGGGTDPKTMTALFTKQFRAEHPNASAAEVQTAANNFKVSGQMQYLMSVPWWAAKGAANKRIIDKNTGEMITPNITAAQVNAGMAAGKYGTITDKQGDALDAVNRVGAELSGLAQVMPKVLSPAIKGKPFKTWAQTMAQHYRIPFLAKAGSVPATQYEAYRSAMALEMQQILTNSTRPVALQEMGIVIPGVDPKTMSNTLTQAQLIGIVPTQTESMDTAWAKMQNVDRLLRTKRKDILGSAGRSFLDVQTMPGDTEIEEPEMPTPEAPGTDVDY